MAKNTFWLVLLILLLSLTVSLADEIGKKVEKPVGQAIDTLQKTQKEDEEWRQLKEKLAYELEQLQESVDQLQAQKNELMEATTAAKKRIAQKEQTLEGIQQIEEKMEPFLASLVERVKKLPKEGLPFLPEERAERIQKLETTLHDPEIELSEKFRKAMEALQVEMEYGLTIETYQKQIELDSEKLLVNVFRLGRLGLYFQTLDQRTCGMFDPGNRKWTLLPESENYSIQRVVEIAAKRRPAELVSMPLGRMVQP